MKTLIIHFTLLLPLRLLAQITFEGDPIPVDSLNSSNGQNYLILHPSKLSMAFTEERSGIGSGNLSFDVRKVILFGAEWQVLVLSDYLGEKGMISPVGFDGDQLIYSQVYFDKGVYSGKVIRIREQEALEIPFFKNKSPLQSGCLSSDCQYMILSMESNNTYGVEDLYVSQKKIDGTWSSLKNLGYQVNTNFQEITPYLAADNRTLFFATNGRGGEGSFDLFYTTRLDESWRKWSNPVNLGPQVNTNGAETSFVFQDGSNWAYFISSKDSDGYGDIMRIKIREDIEEDTTKLEAFLKPDQVTLDKITLMIVDRKTKEPLVAELILDTLELFVPQGVFVLDSIHLITREIEVKSIGYLPKVILPSKELLLGINEIEMDRVEIGEVFVLRHVLFQRGTANMIEGSEKELKLVMEMMNDNSNIKILIKGHTDNTGDPVKNVQLSEERVKTIKEYLVSHGISSYRVSGKGYGGSQPIASNDTEETRKRNRRVEFEVVED